MDFNPPLGIIADIFCRFCNRHRRCHPLKLKKNPKQHVYSGVVVILSYTFDTVS